MKTHLLALLSLFTFCSLANANPYAAESAIYKIEIPHPNGQTLGLGTGVLVAPNKILTNCHIMKQNPGWPRVVQRSSKQTFTVTQYTQLGDFDACILSGGFAGKPVPFATSFAKGENVWIYGYPANVSVVGQGTISGIIETSNGPALHLIAYCNKGSSGGPVLNAQGQFVSLNWGMVNNNNHCIGIPANILQTYL